MRQRCTGIVLVLLGALACSKAPTAPSGQLTLTARNQTGDIFFVNLVNPKAQQAPVLGQVGPSAAACFILPPYADSSYLVVDNGLGTSAHTPAFIPALSGSWQLSITSLTTGTGVSALVSAGVSCTP
ncbi:MAG TPA: hypothetical protein VLV16_06870 [Gemmatimonadales bacterium]|nr:hypothetical protein [Gemmatimonadales bacterium]